MSTKDVLAGMGGIALFGGLILVSIVLGVAFIQGGVWVSAKLLPWLFVASWVAFAAVVLVVLPLAIPRATRGFSCVALFIASYVFGATLWMKCILLSYFLWGLGAVFVGLFLAGVGVVPIAMLATMFKGMWGQFFDLLIMAIITFSSRAGAMKLAESVE